MGWSYSLHTQMTCFQIIMKEEEEEEEKEKKIEQVPKNKTNFHTLVHKEKYRLRDERVGCIILAHLNLNVLFDLAKKSVCPIE